MSTPARRTRRRPRAGVERLIRARRGNLSPYQRHWNSLAELQTFTDEHLLGQVRQRRCPAIEASVFDAWQQERRLLSTVDTYPEPFDGSMLRTVTQNCTVQFEGRNWSVPFALVVCRVEVRGGARAVQIFHGCEHVASHPRYTERRIVLDPAHLEGPSTERVVAPAPQGSLRADAWPRSLPWRPNNGRLICMPPWRRWPDERAQAARA